MPNPSSYFFPLLHTAEQPIQKHIRILQLQSVSLGRGMSWTAPENLSGRIETYGSFQLGISAKGADIDALCIAPQHITMAEYFNSFVQFLVLISYYALSYFT